jgi:hypothetical protein
MSDRITHEQAFEQLADLALDLVDGATSRAALEAHVAACAICQAELASLRNTTVSLAPAPAGVLSDARRAAVREGLLARAQAGTVPPPAPVADVVPIRRPRTIGQRLANEWFPLITAAALFLGLRVGFTMMKERDQARAAVASNAARITQLQDSLVRRDAIIADLTGANVRVVDLAATGKAQAGARMFWDRASNRWTLVTHHLGAPAAGRTYQLWLVTTKGEKVSAGTFTPDAKGNALVRATYALSERDLAAIAVSVEPTGGSPQPTGDIVLASGS